VSEPKFMGLLGLVVDVKWKQDPEPGSTRNTFPDRGILHTVKSHKTSGHTYMIVNEDFDITRPLDSKNETFKWMKFVPENDADLQEAPDEQDSNLN
jgi:hypothetical protein